MSKILVTGGAGFIGSHTVVELAEAGFTPVIADNFSNADRGVVQRIRNLCPGTVFLHELDCCNREALRQVFSEHEIVGVIHFAAFKAVGESVEKPMKYFENNIGSLISLLQVMEEFEVTDLVFSSSCTVYGNPDHLPVKEDSPLKPAGSPYGFTKQACEQAIYYLAQSGTPIRAVLLRYFNPIGAHPSGEIGEQPLGVPNNLVPFVTQTAIGIRNELSVFGRDYDTSDGTCIRDYIHVVDLARAHVLALQWLEKQSQQMVEVFNVGTGRGYSVQQVIDTFEKVSGQKLNYKYVQRRAGDVPEIYADASKAEQELNWKAVKSLEDALTDAWRWEKALAKQ